MRERERALEQARLRVEREREHPLGEREADLEVAVRLLRLTLVQDSLVVRFPESSTPNLQPSSQTPLGTDKTKVHIYSRIRESESRPKAGLCVQVKAFTEEIPAGPTPHHIYLYLSISISINLSICLSIDLPISIYLYLSISIYLSFYL